MKYKIDELFKSKLGDLNVDYKPEYWNEMQKMLGKEPASGVIVSSVSSTFFSSLLFKISMISSVIIAVGITGYFILNSPEQNENNQATTTNKISERKVVKELDPCADLLIPTDDSQPITSSIKKSDFQTVKLPITIDIFKYLNEKYLSEIEHSIAIEKPFNIDDVSIYNPEEEIYLEVYKEISSVEDPIQIPNTTEKSKDPKNVKPMEKPVKHVFPKKKGLLYYLGFKK